MSRSKSPQPHHCDLPLDKQEELT